MGLEEGSSPVLILSLFKWLCSDHGTRGGGDRSHPGCALSGGTFPPALEAQLCLREVPGPGMVHGRAA